MSYILDALRRSDQQRQRHAAPTLLTLQPSAVVRKRPPYLGYGLLVVALIGAGIAIGWLRPWQSPPALRTEAAVVVKPAETPAMPAAPTETAKANIEPRAAVEAQITPAQPQESTPVQPALAPTPTGQATQAQGSVAPHAANPPSSETAAAPSGRLAYTPAAEAPAEAPAIAMADLPSNVRQEMPAMAISVHAWSSKPGSSIIGINYKILHEGDFVAPGLKVEEITQQGAIFTYKGYRFSRGLKP